LLTLASHFNDSADVSLHAFNHQGVVVQTQNARVVAAQLMVVD
jgi:hypothetical protein